MRWIKTWNIYNEIDLPDITATQTTFTIIFEGLKNEEKKDWAKCELVATSLTVETRLNAEFLARNIQKNCLPTANIDNKQIIKLQDQVEKLWEFLERRVQSYLVF